MQRVKRPPVRNKINMADPVQVRAWSRRLHAPVDALQAIVERVGNSVAAVTKEVELQRQSLQPCPMPSIQGKPAEDDLPASASLTSA
jgi:hypothetical protein